MGLSKQSITHPVTAPQPAPAPSLGAPSLPADAGADRAGWQVGAEGASLPLHCTSAEGRKWGIKINFGGEFLRQRCKGPKPEESEFGKKGASGLSAAGNGRDTKTNFLC